MMNDQELKAINDVVIELRKMERSLYLVCDEEVADDVCMRVDKACRLIDKLTEMVNE